MKIPDGKPTEEQRRCVEVAKVAQFFILQRQGPLIFVIMDQNKKTKVVIGNTNECSSCAKDYCAHIAFVLLKVLKIDESNPLLYKRGYTDYEIDKIFSGR